MRPRPDPAVLLPDDPLDIPWAVVEPLGEQLGIEDVSCVKQYTEREPTAYEHAWEIRDAYVRRCGVGAEEPKRTTMLTAVTRHGALAYS